MPKILHPESEAQWLELRKPDVTSTESAALFGLSPYTTELELWLRKAGQLAAPFEENERMRWGKRLERAIANGIGDDYGVRVRRLSAYMRHDTVEGMGASFDYEVIGLVEPWDGEDTILRQLYRKHGPGNLEVKNVDGLIFRDQWLKDPETKEIEAPAHIEVQVQHQLEVSGRAWGAIALLVGGNRPVVIARERDVEVGKKIAHYIAAFWKSVRIGRQPSPDYSRDLDVLKDVYRIAGGEPLDLRHSNRLPEVCREYQAAAADEKAAKARKDAAMAEVLDLIGNAPLAFAQGFKITAGTVAATEVSYTRKAYRNVRISAAK